MSQNKQWRSRTDVKQYEPFYVNGEQVGEVSFLRQSGTEGRTFMTGMWRCGVSEFRYPFGLHETFVMTKGTLRVKLDDGTTEEYNPGDTASFEMGTDSTWTVVEPVEHFFVVND